MEPEMSDRCYFSQFKKDQNTIFYFSNLKRPTSLQLRSQTSQLKEIFTELSKVTVDLNLVLKAFGKVELLNLGNWRIRH